MAAGGQTPATLAEQRAREADAAWQRTERAARAHPGVRAAIEVLGAQIRKVEPASAPPA
jgi:hypothetical protein